MRVLKGIVIVLFVSLYVSCAPKAPLSISHNGVSVTVAEDIRLDERKLEALKDYKVVPRVHFYAEKRLRKLIARRGIDVDITITFLRIKTSVFSVGAGRIGVDVAVKKGGREVYAFKTSSLTTRSGSNVKRMSKDLSKRIYKELKDL